MASAPPPLSLLVGSNYIAVAASLVQPRATAKPARTRTGKCLLARLMGIAPRRARHPFVRADPPDMVAKRSPLDLL
jgi:hypothetical protein